MKRRRYANPALNFCIPEWTVNDGTKSLRDLKEGRKNDELPKKIIRNPREFDFLESIFDLDVPKLGISSQNGEGDRETPKTEFKFDDFDFTPQLDLVNIKYLDLKSPITKEEKSRKSSSTEENSSTESNEDSDENSERLKMADEEAPIAAEQVSQEQITEEAEKSEENAETGQEEEKEVTETIEESVKSVSDPDMTVPSDAAIPSDLELGVSVKPGEDPNSEMKLNDPEIQERMHDFNENIKTLKAGTDKLREELSVLEQKEGLTDEEAKELFEKQEELKYQVDKFDEYTRALKPIVGLKDMSSNEFADMVGMLPYPHDKSSKPREKDLAERGKSEDRFEFPVEEYKEDQIPRVIICGRTEDNVPKIIVGDSQKRPQKRNCLQNLTGKLSESLLRQEKLVKENQYLEDGKYQLAEALLDKDKAVENLERKLCGLQAELRSVVRENKEQACLLENLRNRVQSASSSPRSPLFDCGSPVSPVSPVEKAPCGCEKKSRRLSAGASTESFQTGMNQDSSPRTVCPKKLEMDFGKCLDNSKELEQQLRSKECEVQILQQDLLKIQRDRTQLAQQRKLLKCAGPCGPCTCCPPPGASQGAAFPPTLLGSSASKTGTALMQQQLREQKEQYSKLQDDYKSKCCEIACLRADADRLKKEAQEARCEKGKMENKLMELEEKWRSVEDERDKYYGNREQIMEQEQALNVAKRRFREAQEELEELRSSVQENATQIEDYRHKYLQAQQKVEEQKRQLDMMEMDNARMNENVTLEIGRVKNQFQEKLAELAPLPDILKQTQMKLQETQQHRLLAERNCEDLTRELSCYKEKFQHLQEQLDCLRCENQALRDDKGPGNMEKNYAELKKENERLQNGLSRVEERNENLKKCLDEKLHEIAQLSAALEQMREDAARQVTRTKERSEAMKKNLQCQISEMEKELVQCRAAACAVQKDRDEIRQKMQTQINNLNESFQQAQGRIKLLQGHVNFLKDSCTNIFQGRQELPPPSEPGAGRGTGYDSCDCKL